MAHAGDRHGASGGGGSDTLGAVVILVTGPDVAALETVATALVEERLVACVNLIPAVGSVYRWEGAVHRDAEALAILKTTRDRVAAVRTRALELHPYDVPEFLVLPVESGARPYLEWIAGSVGERSSDDGA